MSDKATPRPWHINGKSIESEDEWVSGFDSRGCNDNDEANARLIVRAVNNFDKLREACKQVIESSRGTSGRLLVDRQAEDTVRAALKASEEE